MEKDSYEDHLQAFATLRIPPLSDHLGQGGYGYVFKSQKQTTSSWSAIKFIIPHKSSITQVLEGTTPTPVSDCEDANDDMEKKRLKEQREYENAVGKRHKNILQIKSYTEKTLQGEEDILSFFGDVEPNSILKEVKVNCILLAEKLGNITIRRLEMELGGPNLKQWLAEEGLGKLENLAHLQLAIINGLISGVRYLHGKGILHRDLTPSNVCFSYSDSEKYLLPVKITDFGLSREFSEEGGKPMDGDLSKGVVTPSYRAPEVSTGNYSFPVDLYSLGLVVWEVLQLIKEKDRRPLFIELLDNGNTDVVQECEQIPGGKELVLNLTKKNVQDRTQSIEQVNLLHLQDYEANEIIAKDLSHLQILLECHNNIILLDNQTDFEGNFEINRDNIRLQGSGDKIAIKSKTDIGLEVSGNNCNLSNFTLKVIERGIMGVLVKGNGNEFKNISVSGSYQSVLVQGADNTFNQIKINGAKNGIRLDGSNNKLCDLEMTEISTFGLTIHGENAVIENFNFSPIKIDMYNRSGTSFSFGLSTRDTSYNLAVSNSICGAVQLHGKSHTLTNVDCGQYIEVRGSVDESQRHVLHQCKGKIYLTDELGFSQIQSSQQANNFGMYSKGLDLQQRLDSCQAGDVIELDEGMWIGSFVLRKDRITLRGKGDSTLLASGLHQITTTIHIVGDNCKISNCKVLIPYGGTIGCLITGSNCIIENVSFVGGMYGLYVVGNGNEMRELRLVCCAAKKGMFDKDEASTSYNPRAGIFIRGNYNKVIDVDYDKIHRLQGDSTFAVFLADGTSNEVENLVCKSKWPWTESNFGIGCHFESSSAVITNSICQRISIDGRDHRLVNVSATELIEVKGKQGHTLVNCVSNLLRITDLSNLTMDSCTFADTQLMPQEVNNADETMSLKFHSSPVNSKCRAVCNSIELKDCLDACNPGDVILLQEGLYEGDFNVRKSSITLKGVGLKTLLRNELKIDPDSTRLYVSGNNCTISDLAIVVVGESASIFLNSSGNLVENVTFLGGRHCLAITGEDNVLTRLSFSDAFNGISVNGGKNNRIECVEMQNVSETGIWIRSNGSNTIVKSVNLIDVRFGIKIDSGDGNVLSDLTLEKGNHGHNSTGVGIMSGVGNVVNNLKCKGLQRWKADYGVEIGGNAFKVEVNESICERVRVAGSGHSFRNVDCGVGLKVEGTGHVFEKCISLKVDNLGENVEFRDCRVQENGQLVMVPT